MLTVKRLPLTALLSALFAGLVALAVSQWLYDNEAQTQARYKQALLNVSTNELEKQIQREITDTLQLSISLVALIESQPDISGIDISRWLTQMLNYGKFIKNISVAPDNKVSIVVPLAGNEAAIGLHYPDLKLQWPAISAIIQSRQAKLTGPIDLVQGGRAFIYRIPVYQQDSKQYWGMVSTLIDSDKFQDAITLHAKRLGLRFTLADNQTPFYRDGHWLGTSTLKTPLKILSNEWWLETELSQYAAWQPHPLLRVLQGIVVLSFMLIGFFITLNWQSKWRMFAQYQQAKNQFLDEQQQQLALAKVSKTARWTVNELGHIQLSEPAAMYLQLTSSQDYSWDDLLALCADETLKPQLKSEIEAALSAHQALHFVMPTLPNRRTRQHDAEQQIMLLFSATPHSKNSVAYTGHVQDISDWVGLAKTHDIQNLVATQSTTMAMILDMHLRVLWASEPFCRFFGVSLTGIEGMAGQKFLQGLYSDEQQQAELKQHFAERQPFHLDIELYNNDEHARYFRADISPHLSQGQCQYVVTFQDHTASQLLIKSVSFLDRLSANNQPPNQCYRLLMQHLHDSWHLDAVFYLESTNNQTDWRCAAAVVDGQQHKIDLPAFLSQKVQTTLSQGPEYIENNYPVIEFAEQFSPLFNVLTVPVKAEHGLALLVLKIFADHQYRASLVALAQHISRWSDNLRQLNEFGQQQRWQRIAQQHGDLPHCWQLGFDKLGVLQYASPAAMRLFQIEPSHLGRIAFSQLLRDGIELTGTALAQYQDFSALIELWRAKQSDVWQLGRGKNTQYYSVKCLIADTYPGGSVMFTGATHALNAEQQAVDLDSLPVGIFAVQHDGKHRWHWQYHNQSFAKLLNIPARCSLVSVYRALKKSQPAFLAQFRKKVRGGLWQAQFSPAPGRVYLFSAQHRTVDKHHQWCGMVLDISEQVRSERQLKASSERLALAAKGAQVGVWHYDITSRQTEWDDTMYQLFSVSREQYPNPSGVFERAVHPDDAQSVNSYIEQAVHHKTNFNQKFRILTADGRQRWIKSYAVVQFDEHEQVIGLLGTNWDITEQEEYQQQAIGALSQFSSYKTAIDAHSIVSQTDLAGRITDLNQLFCEISGYSREELLGQDHRIINSGTHSKDFWKHIWKTLRGGNIWQGEICNKRKDGRFYWVETTISPMFNSERKIIGYCAVRTEITDIVLGRQAALDTNQHHQRLLSYLNHEIRVPLNNIQGMLDCLQSTELNDHQQYYLQLAQNNGTDLLRIVADVMDFSQLQQQQWQLTEHDVDLDSLLQALAERYQPLCQARNMQFYVDISWHLAGLWHTDGERLMQLVQLLLDHALHVSSEGYITLSADAADQTVCIEVLDYAGAMDSNDLKQLLHPFPDNDSRNPRLLGGSSLTLAIAKRLAQFLGGDISSFIASSQQVGYRCELPLHRAFSSQPNPMQALAAAKQLALVCQNPRFNDWFCKQWPSHWSITLVDATTLNENGLAGLANEHDKVFIHQSSVDIDSISAMLLSHGGVAANKLVVFAKPLYQLSHSELYERIITEPLTAQQLYLRAFTEVPSTAVIEQPVPLAGKKVLVVDDNEINRFIAKTQLTALACVVIEADNGKTALQQLSAQTVDLVLMDCQMPLMDGFQATQAIRAGQAGKNHLQVPIIAMTADTLTQDRQKCLAVGMNDFLAKPLAPNELATIMRQHLHH